MVLGYFYLHKKVFSMVFGYFLHSHISSNIEPLGARGAAASNGYRINVDIISIYWVANMDIIYWLVR